MKKIFNLIVIDLKASLVPLSTLTAYFIFMYFRVDVAKDTSKIETYVLSANSFPIILISMISFANLLMKEERQGTIEFLYGMPISRTQIFFSKFLTGILIAVYFIILTFFSQIFTMLDINFLDLFSKVELKGVKIFKQKILISVFLKFFFMSIIIGQLALLFDQIIKKYSLLMGLSIIYASFNFIIVFSKLLGKLDSVVVYFAIGYLVDTPIDLQYILSFSAISIVLVGINYIYYIKRDFVF